MVLRFCAFGPRWPRSEVASGAGFTPAMHPQNQARPLSGTQSYMLKACLVRFHCVFLFGSGTPRTGPAADPDATSSDVQSQIVQISRPTMASPGVFRLVSRLLSRLLSRLVSWPVSRPVSQVVSRLASRLVLPITQASDIRGHDNRRRTSQALRKPPVFRM